MKRAVCFFAAAILTAAILTGCAKKDDKLPFTSRNEIVTYRKIDPGKTQIVVSRTGNIQMQRLVDDFEAQNADVQVIQIDITGGNASYNPLADWVEHGYTPDVVVVGASCFSDEMSEKYFESLLTSPAIESIDMDALRSAASGDDVFWLPGPSGITAMMYNKTLFAQYGWAVPKTFDEFVTLCKRIRQDTGGAVEPWNPNAKYDNELKIALEAFVYEELFAGVENHMWYNDFTAGEAGFASHMEPCYDVIQTLVDNDILREEHFAYSATARGKEFAAGKIAMINANVYEADNEQYDFGYMPFPTTKGETGYICGRSSCLVGVPKKQRDPKQADAVSRFLTFFASPEGQQSYIDGAMMVSNVKGVPLMQSDDLAALQPAIDAGHMFALLDFHSDQGASCNVSLYRAAKEMATGARTKAQCVAEAASTQPYTPNSEAWQAKPEVLAKIKQDMTMLETSFYMADAYRAAANADIGLIAHGVTYRGNLMRMFAGELTTAHAAVLKPRSFANDTTLVKVGMTGRQLMEALNHPVCQGEAPGCIYAYSGLRCEVAPWNEPGKKVLAAKLADGGELDPDKVYTVAAWAGTIDEAYVTGEPEVVAGTWEDLLTAKLKADGSVAPANDGRIALVWK